MKKLLLVMLCFILAVQFAAANGFVYDNPTLPRLTPSNPSPTCTATCSGNSSFNQTAADALYWRLDASNDPPTAPWNMGIQPLVFTSANVWNISSNGNDLRLDSLASGYFRPFTNIYLQQKTTSIPALTIDEAPAGSAVDLFDVIADGVVRFYIDAHGDFNARNGTMANLSATRISTQKLIVNNTFNAANFNTNFIANQPSGSNGLIFAFTGSGTDGVGDTTGGTYMSMTHNGGGNRQLVLGSSDYLSSPRTNDCFRWVFTGAQATMDAVRCDGSNRVSMGLATDTSEVSIGSNQWGSAPNLPATLTLHSHAGKFLLEGLNDTTPAVASNFFFVDNQGSLNASNGTFVRGRVLSNLTVDRMLTLTNVSLPNCAVAYNGSIMRNNTDNGLYYCNATGTQWSKIIG